MGQELQQYNELEEFCLYLWRNLSGRQLDDVEAVWLADLSNSAKVFVAESIVCSSEVGIDIVVVAVSVVVANNSLSRSRLGALFIQSRPLLLLIRSLTAAAAAATAARLSVGRSLVPSC